MRAPKESLRDFIAPAPKPTDPPAERSLRFSGEIKILKPVEIRHDLVRQRLPWFHRSLAIGSGLAVVLFIAGTIVDIGLFGIGPATTANNLVADQQSKRPRTPPKMPSPFPRFRVTNSLPVSDVPVAVPALIRRGPLHPRVQQIAYTARRRFYRPRLVHSDFIPTKLVIYAENGAIRSRIEPQLTAAYRKPLTIPN